MLDPPICWRCWQAKRDQEERSAHSAVILAELDGWTERQLKRLGLSTREVGAELHRVPRQIKEAMPKAVVKSLLAGEVPKEGFGLGGNTDGGKSMAVAAVMKAALQAWAKREIPRQGDVAPDWFRWTFWPGEVNWMRSHAIDGEVPNRVEELSAVPLLILDDLGRERIKGSYADDWAASQLDAIVNARYNEMRITIWTTNVREKDLAELYGGAMMRRLTSENPLKWIDDLRSAR